VNWDETVFFPAFKATGITVEAIVAPGGGTDVTVDVIYSQPDARFTTGVQSAQHLMEYQAADLPGLIEGDAVTIDGTAFRVREASYIDGETPTGFFRKALLTKV
jgi:hypothetical protein